MISIKCSRSMFAACFLGLKHVLLVMIEDNSDDSSFVTGAQYRVHDGMAAQ